MAEDQREARIAELEKLIDEAPGWGAYVAALGEELRALKRGRPTVPLA
jgi:hypothetical protein